LECPAYQQIRLEYGSKLFSRSGDDLQSAIRVLTREPRKVPDFMNHEPKVVARFVAECLHKDWQSVDDPVTYGDVLDTFFSDYGPSAFIWIPMVGLSLSHQYHDLHLMMTVFLLLLPMEPRLALLGRPALMGPNSNLVICKGKRKAGKPHLV
jgi:hypothetical protein